MLVLYCSLFSWKSLRSRSLEWLSSLSGLLTGVTIALTILLVCRIVWDENCSETGKQPGYYATCQVMARGIGFEMQRTQLSRKWKNPMKKFTLCKVEFVHQIVLTQIFSSPLSCWILWSHLFLLEDMSTNSEAWKDFWELSGKNTFWWCCHYPSLTVTWPLFASSLPTSELGQ